MKRLCINIYNNTQVLKHIFVCSIFSIENLYKFTYARFQFLWCRCQFHSISSLGSKVISIRSSPSIWLIKSELYCGRFTPLHNSVISGFYFGFVLESSDIDLLDTDLGLLDTNIPTKYFVCFQVVLKTSSRHVLRMSSRRLQDMFWRRREDVFSVKNFHIPRRLEEVLKICLVDVFKASSRSLQVVLMTSWKKKNCYTEDMLKTSARHALKNRQWDGLTSGKWSAKPSVVLIMSSFFQLFTNNQ